MTTLTNIIDSAQGDLRDELADNEFVSDPHSLIHEIADGATPTDTATLAEIIAEDPSIAFEQSELAAGMGGDLTPHKMIQLVVFERIEAALWETFNESREDDVTKRWRVRAQGAGGFLNPPDHPAHTLSIETEGGSASLEYVVDHPDQFPAAAVARAKRELHAWDDTGDPDPEWVSQVLGYFRNSYTNTNPDRRCKYIHPNNLGPTRFIEEVDGLVADDHGEDACPRWTVDPVKNIDRHAGVAFIRRFYPDFVPTREQFDTAKWGS